MTIEEIPRPSVQPAGFWIRSLARLVDWLFLAVVGILLGIIMVIGAAILQATTGFDAEAFLASMQKLTLSAWLFSIIPTVLFHTFVEGMSGGSVGKRACGLEVVSTSLDRITLSQGFKRSLAFLFDGLFFGGVGAHFMSESDIKQRIGDHWAETRVVKRKSMPEELRRPTRHLLMGLLVGTFVYSIVVIAKEVIEFAVRHGAV